MEEEKTCGNCGHFQQFYIKSSACRWGATGCGDCMLIAMRKKQARRRSARTKSCEHWVPQAEREAELKRRIKKELLTMADRVSKFAELLEIDE